MCAGLLTRGGASLNGGPFHAQSVGRCIVLHLMTSEPSSENQPCAKGDSVAVSVQMASYLDWGAFLYKRLIFLF